MKSRETVSIPIRNVQLAQLSAGHARLAFMSAYSCPRIIGMRVNSLDNPYVDLGQLDTPPGSTDMLLDVKVALCRASYTLSDSILTALKEPQKGTRNLEGVQIISSDNMAIAEITLQKDFSTKSTLTYKDFSNILTFYGVDDREVWLNVFDKNTKLQFKLYIQIVNGIQGEPDSILMCNELFGVEPIGLAADSLTGLELNLGKVQDAPVIHVCGERDDPRIPKIKAWLSEFLQSVSTGYANLKNI